MKKNLHHPKTTTQEMIFWAVTLVIVIWLYSCKASNKAHTIRIHPHGYWTAKKWVPVNQTNKTTDSSGFANK